jgi:YidC/Oxa1 family membrane protein insertase
MIAAFAPWQALLDGLGAVLAWIYDVIPNYGVTIIVLTVLIRVVLLPLGIKQIKSMQAMQAIQPKVKELQKKYKGNKQKQQEETMKLYREAGVNPLGGCLPLLLQFPILIAMYSILRAPLPNAAYDPVDSPDEPAYVNNHLPLDSELYRDVTTGQNQGFLFMNLQCSLIQAGTRAEIPNSQRQPSGQFHDCGESRFPDIVPYAVLLALMVGSTLYTQRQMQRASPPSASQQQQVLLKIMPVMFGFFGLQFPAGLVLYWTVSNLIQMAQQTFLLRAGHIGPQAMERRMAESRAKAATQPERTGFMARLMERADDAQKKRETQLAQRGNPSARKPSGKQKPPQKRQQQKGDGGSTARPKPKRPRRGPGSGT